MTMTRKTITIPNAMEDWVKAQVAAGRYASDSEYFRDLIRRDRERREAEASLRRMLDEAEASGIGERRVADIMTDVEARLRADGRIPPDSQG